jgi:hypothetical protein
VRAGAAGAAGTLAVMHRLVIAAVLLAATLATALPAEAATVRVQRFSGFQDVRVTGAQQTRYRLRLAYTVPGTWKARSGASGLSRSFGPIGSCRFTVRVSARAVVDASEPAATRVARLAPAATSRHLLDSGTRTNRAWRVVRASGAQSVSGLLVRPAPSVKTQPAGGRVWLEVRFRATPDPRRECHSGGPRTVGAQTGDALATASVGGFQL